MKWLKKEYNICYKKTIGTIIAEALIISLLVATCLYFVFSKFNGAVVHLFNLISEGQITAFNVILILFPVILIITLMIILGNITVHKDTK